MGKIAPAAPLLVALASGALSGCGGSPVQARTLEHLSPVYTVDREYRSMMGPSSQQTIRFPEADADPPELLWVTGYRAEVVAADGETPMPQEFMCHSNLDFNAARHARLFNLPIYHTSRLFTLSQGQQEIHLPEGFGLPYWSDETFDLATQVLNLNPDGQTREMRHHVTIEYVRDADLREPLKPLFMTSGWGLVLLEGDDGHYGLEHGEDGMHGPSCLPGDAAGPDRYEDGMDRVFSGHWVVEPGRQVNHTNVTRLMKLPYDTTVHYVAVHLHPFAESLELIDLTEGKTVFRSEARGYDDKIGLSRVESFSSPEGIPVHADHEYDLVSTYNNTTDRDQDSMAVMLLYLHDKLFSRSVRERRTTRVVHVETPVQLDPEEVVLHTTQGELRIALYPEVAPAHVERFKRLVRDKLYDATPFVRVDPGFLIQLGYPRAGRNAPLPPGQLGLEPLHAELSDLPHRLGTVSMTLEDNADPHSAVASFFITLADAPHLDESYTIFGKVVDGLDTLQRIAAVPVAGTEPLEEVAIESAELLERRRGG